MKYKCIVSYDGYDFNGYQIQKHDKNTIQENIQNALKVIFKEDITIFASGRTDSKVHALAQVFHFESNIRIPVNNLKKALNNNLINSIRIKKIEIVDNSFHARFNSHSKTYVYKIINSNNESCFKNRYFAYIKDKIDIEKLIEASKLFIGIHDFYGFTTNKEEEIESFVKTIYDVKVNKVNNVITITFEGSGFLRYQVRMMVGMLIAISTNKETSKRLEEILNSNHKLRCSYKANPCGLYLKEVKYD